MINQILTSKDIADLSRRPDAEARTAAGRKVSE